MLSMKIDYLVSQLVRQELVDKGREKEALHFHFDLSMAHYLDGETYTQRCGLHLLYFVKPQFSYISVFSAVTDSPFTKVKEVETWKHETTHDSCWNSIQVFSQVYFSMAKNINAMLKEDGLPEIAPKDMSENHFFRLFSPVFDWVPVEVQKDPEDRNNYRRIVKVL